MGNTAAASVLESVAEASGRLLRVDRDPLPGPAGARASTRLRLTFDVVALELHLDRQAGSIQAETSATGEGCSVCASEEEPWWALIGNPLTRVSARGPAEILLQFRQDEDSPRILVATGEAGGVAVRALG